MGSGTTAKSAQGLQAKTRTLLELCIGYALILIVLWTPRPWQRRFYLVAAAFVLGTTLLSFPGLRQMGLRPTAFRRSWWVVKVASVLCAGSVFLARWGGTLHAPHGAAGFVRRFTGYVLFACIQQFLLQDYFLERLLRIVKHPRQAAVAAAGIFALAHLPNPILTCTTFVWGWIACAVFLRDRNLYPLAVAHAILGIMLAITIPATTLHNMRVGLGYLTYHPRHLHDRAGTPALNGQ